MSEKRLFVGKKTTEDRFTIILDYDDEIGIKENRSGDVIVLKHRDLNSEQFVGQLVMFLNDQNEAIHQAWKEMQYWSDKTVERIKEVEKENEQLKSENRLLKGRMQEYEEQIRTTQIVSDTPISDDDCKKLKEILIKHFGKR